jgi:uncharacterized RDD family membrane protein YckC
MTFSIGFAQPLVGLPDPDRDPQFYDGVPSRRLVAWIIDVCIAALLTMPVAVAFGVLTLGFGFLMLPLVYAVTSFLYRTLTIAGGSATWGMRAMGIELRRGDGSRFDLIYATAHVAIYTVCVGMLVLQLASIVAIVGTRYHQGLHDLILGTTAINSPED